MAREMLRWWPLGAIVLGGAILSRLLGDREPLGDAILLQAEKDLDVREDLGRNDGVRIREYFAGSGIVPPANWCAAAVTTWIREAAGGSPPIPGSMSAKGVGEQIAERGSFHTADDLRADPSLLRPGMVVVWDRSQPDRPETSWWGHVGVVASSAQEGAFGTIEGNSGPDSARVARVTRRLDDPRLIGAGAAWRLGQGGERATRALRAPAAWTPPEEGGG